VGDTRPAVADVLARQLEDARQRVAEARATETTAALRARALMVPSGPSLVAALGGSGAAVIAEVKRASPSRGDLAPIADPVAHARAYLAGGAAAISVLTAPLGFRGSLADLAAVARLGAPTLRKDFVVDAHQVWEARAAGAAAILLLAVALDDEALAGLLAVCDDADLDALVEVHTADELARVARLQPPLIGINVRDLRDFSVDPARFERLAAARPPGSLLVAESGVTAPADVASYAAAGADAVLVGEHLVRSPDPVAATAALVAAGRAAAADPHPGAATDHRQAR